MPPLRSSVNKLSLNLVNSDTVIKVSKLGEKAGAIGASLLAKHHLLFGKQQSNKANTWKTAENF